MTLYHDVLQAYTDAKVRAVLISFGRIIFKLAVPADATDEEVRALAWQRIKDYYLQILADNKEDIK